MASGKANSQQSSRAVVGEAQGDPAGCAAGQGGLFHLFFETRLLIKKKSPTGPKLGLYTGIFCNQKKKSAIQGNLLRATWRPIRHF